MAQGTTKGVPIDIDPTLSADSDLLVPSQKAIKTYTDLGLSNKVSRAGDTMLGNLILNANPTFPFQAATKDYVDTLINGIDWKQSVNAATVAALPAYNVTGSGQILTGVVNGAIPSVTTDGVTLVANQRVLVKNETLTLTPNNGIYIVTQAGSPSLPFILTRATDANTPSLLAEATVSVSSGSTFANTQWHCNPASVPLIIGTTYITFAQIGSGVYTAGAGLTLTGNVFSIGSNAVVDSMIASATDWNTAYTNRITSLTTTGDSGAATLISNTLNIPNYTLNGLGGVPTSRTISTSSPLSGGGDLSADRTISIADAVADGTTKGAATFTANDFNSVSGVVSIDYTNGQKATALLPGFLSAADWSTFNGKQDNIEKIILTGVNQTTTAATAQNITGLVTSSLTANKNYTYHGTIRTTCSGAGGVRFGISLPAGATARLTVVGLQVAATATSMASSASTGALTGSSYAQSGTTSVFIYGKITMAATPGTMQFQFASQTAGQTSTIVHSGETFLTLIKMD